MEYSKEDIIEIIGSLNKEKLNAEMTFDFNTVHNVMKATNHTWTNLNKKYNYENTHIPTPDEIKNKCNYLYNACYDDLFNDLKNIKIEEHDKQKSVYEHSSGGITVTIKFFSKYKENEEVFSEDDWTIVQYKYEITSKPLLC